LSVHRHAEHGVYLPQILLRQHGVEKHYQLGFEFLNSPEYQQIVNIGQQITNLIEPTGFLKRGEKVRPVTSFEEALQILLDEGKRGLYIQRYKGLGEMNPEQLWETTMDPMTRRMLQVTIEDGMAADQLFATLMGDNVEPRRAFIESNALKVANLDI
jgi:DNA gyrase subunit B